VSSGRARGGWWVIFWGWDPHNQPEGLWLCGSGSDLGLCGVGLWMGCREGAALDRAGRTATGADRLMQPAVAEAMEEYGEVARTRGLVGARGLGLEDGPGAVFSCWACLKHGWEGLQTGSRESRECGKGEW
jgi:hypothetical protein